MRVRFLSGRDKEGLVGLFSGFFTGVDFKRFVRRVDVRVVEDSGVRVFVLGEFLFGVRGDVVFPLVVGSNNEVLDRLGSVVVDRGAVPHIVSGAHVMRPGIVQVVGDFLKDCVVVIRDEIHRKPIAVGRALYDADVIKNMERGRVVENLHYVDDKFWKLALKIKI